MPVLANAIERIGVNFTLPGHHVDTLKLARAALTTPRKAGSHTLGTVYEEATGQLLGGAAHDAVGDAMAVAQVWQWLIRERGADPRVPVETPDRERFASHLALVARHGPPQSSIVSSGSRGKKPTKGLPPGSLLAINGLGAVTEAKLKEMYDIDTVSKLREAIARGHEGTRATPNFIPHWWGLSSQPNPQHDVAWVGGDHEGAHKACVGGCKRWLMQSGLRLHPGSPPNPNPSPSPDPDPNPNLNPNWLRLHPGSLFFFWYI